MLSDPRYIRYYVELRHYDFKQDKHNISNHLLHKCTSEEFKRFYSPKDPEIAVKTKRIQEDGDFFCLDWKAVNFSLYGSWAKAGDSTAINVKLVPCAEQF